MVHECKNYKGNPYILDVSYRNNNYYCRSCGKQLKDDEVAPEIIKMDKKK